MVSEEELLELARLARLELSATEKQELLNSLPKILEHISMLESFDVASAPPTVNVHGATNAFREDRAEDSALRHKILEGVPRRNGDFISTPIVIDEESS